MLEINSKRLLDDLASLGEIGKTAQGGVSRPALSPADLAGREWFEARAAEAALEFAKDGAGNLSARLSCANPDARTLLLGSHLDTVPNGGRYDGALGVLSALEALRTIKEADVQLPAHLEAIAFTDEEGTHIGLLGSRALAGQLSEADLAQSRTEDRSFDEGLARLSLSRESVLAARREPDSLVGFVELHVEQGTRLERAGIDLGVVTSIVGIRSYWLHFGGQAAHAGTMPMADRADALWGAAWFVGQARELVMERFFPGVVNCGELEIEPGAFNIVPGEARLGLEFRHGTEAALDEMETALLALAEEAARRHGLTLTAKSTGRLAAAPMAESIVEAVEQAAGGLGLSYQRLISFAGHDAQALSSITPTAMIFVPSVGGISHHPAERTADEDVINGANTLLHTILRIARA